MKQNSLFETNVKKIVRDCCALKPNEKVLIITDDKQEPDIYNSIYQAVSENGGNPILLIMPVSIPGNELPDIVNAAAMEADLIITPTTTSIYHAPGIHRACENGHARLQALSECEVSTFIEGGINADFKGIVPIVELVGEKYDKGSSIHYRTPGGTDITASIEGRKVALNSGICAEAGTHMGLPTIEVFIAPIEESVNGTIVCDLSCSGGIGIVSEPIVITIKDGKAVKFSGGKEAAQLEELLARENDPSVYQVAELAIGLNPECNITGIINEDEGKYGTCHMALGSNASFGGINLAPLHIDMVQNLPTIEIDGECITKDGKLTLAEL